MDQKVEFGGTIGCGESYLEFLSRKFKVFRLHAILHDAAGAVWAHSGRDLGYLLLHDWAMTNIMFARSCDWTTFLPLRKTLSALRFQLCRLLKQYVLHSTKY